MARAAFLLACLLLAPWTARTQNPERGSIQGKVVDAKTGEGLPGANITIKGTYYGGTSGIDGSFKVEKVNPGDYTVDVSLLGYKTVQFTPLRVGPGKVTQITAKMVETVLQLDQDIVVIGEKPLFNIEETSSRRNIGQAEISASAVQSVQEVVALQPGVVFADNEIHIRGGRTHETAYLIDGVSVQDPLAGTGFGLQLSPGSIQEMEVITGGYNAEYGQATSGIVNITTREGSDRYAGSLTYRTDHIGQGGTSRANWNTDILDATLSGPEPLTTYLFPALGLSIPGTMSFFGTIYSNLSDGYMRWVETLGPNNAPNGYEAIAPKSLYSSTFNGSRFAPRRDNAYSMLAKLTYRPSSIVKIAYSFNESVVINQNTQTIQATLERVEPNPGYQFYFQYIPDSANTFTQRNIQHSLTWTHTLSKQMFYEVRLSLYTASVRGDANGKTFDAYLEPQDIITYPVKYYNQGRDTVGVVPGDGFFDLGSPDTWRDHYIQESTIKVDLTNYFTERNKFKAGIEMRFQDMQMADLRQPWVKPLGYDNDIYAVRAAQGALYAQESITLSGMILNAGLRFDYWVPGSYVDDIANDTSSALIVSPALRQSYLDNTFSLFGYRAKGRLSPRVGISHPVSDNQTLFFSYGHFSKFPRPQYVYSKLDRVSVRSTLPVGNPDLDPETTVAYELGVRNQLSGSDVLTVTAFYKDIFDYITEKNVRRVTGISASQTYTTYLNSDYSRVRGVEVEYKKRIGNWFRGTFSGSYSTATGKSSTPNENIVRLQLGEPENITENYLIWDRPIQASLSLNFSVPKGDPLFGVGGGLLDDWNLFLRLFYQSGKRYTPQNFTGLNAVTGRPEYVTDNSRQLAELGAPWFMVDLNLEKTIDLSFSRLVLSIEVQNLLDRKNSQIINPVTGRAYEYGDPTTSGTNDPLYPTLSGNVSPFPYTPARYLSPRTVRAALAFRF